MNVRYLISWLIGYALSFTSVYADCQIPQGSYTYNLTYQSASLSWSYYGSNSPTYQLQWRISGNATWTTNPVLTTPGTSLTGLTNNTIYEWHVRSICAAGDTSAYMSTQTFQTKCDLPYALQIANVTHQSAQISWYTPVSGATYEVQWRPAGAATWIIVSGLTTNSLNLRELPEDTSFEWKVRTICSTTETSDFSTGPSFRTICLPPSNAHVTRTNPEAAELKWDRPVANVLFDLQWRQAGTSSWTLIEGIGSTDYILTGLTNATSYEWQVRTACSATSKSTFTDIQLFQTSCPSPIDLGTGSVTYNSAIIQWTSFAAELQWRAAGTADWTTVSNAASPYTLTGLINNTVYEWRVRTVCSSTEASAYTSSQLLTTQCPAPSSLYGYADNGGGLRLGWYSQESGVFEVQWRAIGTASWSVATGIVRSTYSLTSLVPATTYAWRVRKVCSDTDYSDFITGQAMTTACNAPTYLQTQNATNTKIELIWDGGELGGRYEIQWRIVNTPTWTTISDSTAGGYTLTSLQPNTQYEWRVRRLCSSTVASAFSDSQTFTLTCAQPTSFSTRSINFSSATISWSGVNSYAPYEIQYRQAGATDWITVADLSSNQYSVSGLSNNTTYEWRVRSSCPSAGPPDFSAVQTFQIQCNSLFSNVYAGNVDYSSAVLYWNANSNTSLYEIQYRETGSSNWIILQPEATETDPYFAGITYNYLGKQYTLYNLTPGKTYEWRVRALCSSSVYSDFVNGPTFTTACLIPTGMSSYPQTNTTLAISWDSYYFPLVTTHYDLQWRPVGASNWITISGLTSKVYTLTGLTPGISYEYRVRRQCSADVVSDFSIPLIATLQCGTPSFLTTEASSATSARLAWSYYYDGSNGATGSSDLQYRVAGTDEWTTVTGIIGTTYSLTGLTAGVNYECRVRTFCSAGVVSDFSSSTPFILNCNAPSVNSYYNQIGTTSALLSWNNGYSLPKSYLLQWRVLGDPGWTSVSVPYTSNASTYSLTGLTNNTSYEWRVATDCGDGYLSDFSYTQSFQTSCGMVQYLTVNTVGATSAHLSWSGANLLAQSRYTLQYRVNGTVVWSEVSGITSTTSQLTGLSTNTTYEWRVRAECESGVATIFSPKGTFLTQCPGPVNTYTYFVTTKSALLSWIINAENSAVNLQWRQANSNRSWNEVNGLTGAAYSLTGLTPATNYEYRLQGVCNASSLQLSPVGFNRGFSTLYPPTPTFSVYPDSVLAMTAGLDWRNGPDKTNYILQWRVRNAAWNTTGLLSTKGYVLTGLTPNTTYDVRVSYIENGVTYDATTSFTTNCLRMNLLSAVDITSTSARLTWSSTDFPVSTLGQVSVQWRIAGSTAWNTVTGVKGNSYTLAGLSDNVLYEWRIQTLCSADITNSSYPASFQTICQMPIYAGTQKVTTSSALVSWSGSGPTYSVRYRVAGTSAWTTVTGLTSTTFALTGLVNDTNYEWAVATVCAPGTSTIYTSPVSFKTQCSLPEAAYTNFLTATQVQLVWNSPEPACELQWRAVGSTTWSSIAAVTSPYMLTGLITGTTYEWRVRAACAMATDGPFASGNSFTPQCTSSYPNYIQTTTTDITANMAQLIWYPDFTSIYGLRWRLAGSTSWTDIAGRNLTSPYALTGLTNNTTYEWQLSAECQSVNNPSQFFQTRCNAPIYLWAEDLTTTSARLNWNDSRDGMGYEVQWRLAGTSSWNVISGITSTSCLLSGLTNYTDYEWQVRSQCENEVPFQLTALFKTVNACSSEILYTIRDGSWDDPTIWSCNRVPTSTDKVKLNHKLVIPNAYVAKALTIYYETGARLTFGIGASVNVGK